MDNHGGNIFKYANFLSIKPDKMIDFSCNTNPLKYPKAINKVIKNNLKYINHYPDPEYNDLKCHIAKAHNVSSKNIVVGNGAIEVIDSFIKAINPKNVLIVSPTFSEYKKSFNKLNIEVSHFLLDCTNDFCLKIKEFLCECRSNYDLIVVCNPNNPTGTLINKSDLLKIVDELNVHGAKLLIDESFIDFVKEKENFTMIDELVLHDNIVVVKSLTKFFSIPGIRIGFGYTKNKELIDCYNSNMKTWSVNTLADKISSILYNQNKYNHNTFKLISKEREFLVSELSKFKCLKVFESSVNFLLIKVSNEVDLSELSSCLLEGKILIRNCNNFDGLEDGYIRIAVKNRKDNIKLLKMLRKYFA